MKKLLVLLMVSLMVVGFTFAEVNVTYRINVSTIAGVGVTDSTHQIQVCGSEVGPEGQDLWQNNFLTWDDTSPLAEHVSGDIWELTIAYPDSMINWRMAYKVRYQGPNDDAFIWEAFDGNRMYTLPDTDTTLAMAYVNNGWTPPYTETDSIDVYFRVNMEGLNGFNSDEDSVFIVGAFPGPDGADNMWVPDKYALSREGSSDIFSFDLKLDAAGAPYDSTMYRYTTGSWEQSEQIFGHGMFPDNENRGISVSADTTVAWKWWNDTPPQPVSGDTISLTFEADLQRAINQNGFSIGDGDSICVRVGYFGTAQYVEAGMTKVGISGFNYQATLDSVIINELGQGLFYQYYKIPGAVEGEVRETYFNFDYTGDNNSEAERRQVVITEDGQTIVDDLDSKTEARRMPVFRNTNPVSQNVMVTYELDLRPAYVHVAAGTTLTDIQGAFTITSVDQIDDGGVYMNGPATGGWTDWGATLADTDNKKMWDDGTHGDAVAGDSIYAVQFSYGPDSSNNTIGQEFKFGIAGGDNESGYGLNHIENIDDSESEATIHAQWGSINPNFYSLWDYDNARPVAVKDEAVRPESFELSQNYPNPFNPTTTIEYTLPKTEDVTISIYNLVGELVNRVKFNNLKAGQHDYIWNSKDLHGNSVPSGVYFYEMKAGSYHSVKKMVLMK